MNQEGTRIGAIGNNYGDLRVKEEDEKFFWTIEDCCWVFWDEIPESLYRALMEYENNREK